MKLVINQIASGTNSNAYKFVELFHLLIQETHLRPGVSIRVPNYTLYRNDRQTQNIPSGGTAILVKSSLKYHHIPTPTLGAAEATIVVLTPPGENPLLIASIYIPPTTSPSACIHDLEKIFALEHSSILCGDYNAHHKHWGCNDNNPSGQLIKNLIDNTDTDIVAPNTPTRFGYNSASTIDFALTRNLYWVSDIVSSPELSSDHNPIILNFQTSIQFNFPTRNVSTNWERFRFHLADTPTFQPITAHSGEEIDEQVSTLTNQILTAYDNSSKQIHPNNNYYIDNDLRTLFKTRNRARKIYQYSRNPADKKTTLNRIQNKIKRKIQAVTQKQWEDKLASLDTVDGSLWSTTKGFKKKRSPISALKGNTGIAYTDEEKAETLANSLESQFQLNNISNPTQDNNHIRLVTRFFNNENNFDDSPSITKPSEIVQIINNFKIKKAPGREGITNKMCKHFTRSVVFQLTNIINNILTVGYFPKIWKTASVIPILKPGKDPTLPDSFRPISLLPVLSKITEKIIQKRLCQHLNDNDILIPQQHGFRAGLSTSHQLLRVVEYIKTGFRDRKSTGAVFLDIQKAFDRVWHVGLLYKLIKINTPPHLIKLISSFLTNRSFAVKVNNIHSTNRKIVRHLKKSDPNFYDLLVLFFQSRSMISMKVSTPIRTRSF
ncbi:probable RNA-directed DNA polymerase from transposon X-element [Trichonephila clavipes]|nr:probable RNA-directed DNA polymerase from transposon X-element [Trichonephila clavipes]